MKSANLYRFGVLTGVAALAVAGCASSGGSGGPQTPEVVRVVCTDHICANCDGHCHRNSGHVAVDKNGHCACTPTEGGALDAATRDAYEQDPPK